MAAKTRPCEQCDSPMSRYQGRCPACGWETTWFRLRVWLGAAMVLVGAALVLFLLRLVFKG
ncbi:MAG: hypothetical protein IT368_11785 [Candidatus Hydrogenedentes bacterium]|nr:hypothetical protein [Candidatus Hydrogenedentota bacterium]